MIESLKISLKTRLAELHFIVISKTKCSVLNMKANALKEERQVQRKDH